MKVFEAPEIELQKFDVMDVIATGGDGNIGGEGGYDSGENL